MKRRVVVGVIVCLSLVMFGSASIHALSDAQKRIMQNGILYFNVEALSCTTGGSTALVGGDNIQKGYNYFVAQGLSNVQSAAIIGNFMQESSMNPASVQPGGKGRGIAQWSVDDRWIGVVALANKNGVQPTTLAVQLDYVWAELTGSKEARNDYSQALKDLKKLTDIKEATVTFEKEYEAAGDPQNENRIEYAQQVLDKYGGGGVSGADAGRACGPGSVNCEAPGAGPSQLSPIRQQVVCIAKDELSKWAKGELKEGTDFHKYSQGRNENWCADFSSWVYNQAGYQIGPSKTAWNVASVAEIRQIGESNGRFHWHDASNYTPMPGDLIIHQNDSPHYSHVNIVTTFNANDGKLTQLGGNQSGDGSFFNSVVNEYTRDGFSGGSDYIVGYVSPE